MNRATNISMASYNVQCINLMNLSSLLTEWSVNFSIYFIKSLQLELSGNVLHIYLLIKFFRT